MLWVYVLRSVLLFFFKQKTAYEMRISDWSSDVCSSDLPDVEPLPPRQPRLADASRLALRTLGRLFDRRLTTDGQAVLLVTTGLQIGRASCRERVCQYV